MENRENGQNVSWSGQGTLEGSSPSVPGPYYMGAEEILPELVASDSEVKPSSSSEEGLVMGRRDVLRLLGLGAAMAACSQRPVSSIVPYVEQPLDTKPGLPNYYATTCGGCPSACGVVAKTREGRAVKLEGNPQHPLNQGSLCATGQAQIQALYHPERLKSPQIRHGGRADDVSWEDLYEQLAEDVKNTPAESIGILVKGSTGHQVEFLQEFLEKLGGKRAHVYSWTSRHLYVYQSKAHEWAFGSADLPRLELKEAGMVWAVESDFLETGTHPVFHSKGLSRGPSYKDGNLGKFVQLESIMSLTGARAGERFVIPPGEELAALFLLMQALYVHPDSKGSTGEKDRIGRILKDNHLFIQSSYARLGMEKSLWTTWAQDLLSQPSVVLAGGSSQYSDQGTQVQLAAILCNVLVGAYGQVLFYDKGWHPCPVGLDDGRRFLEDAADLKFLFCFDVDPLRSVPESWGLEATLEKIPCIVSLQSFPQEVDRYAKYILPITHPLESWGDEQPVHGFWSLRQPVQRTITKAVQGEDVFLWLLAHLDKPMGYKNYHAYLLEKWENLKRIAGMGHLTSQRFIQGSLRRGFAGKLSERVQESLRSLDGRFSPAKPPQGYVLISPLDHRFHDGTHAHCPVLQEIGHGLTTVTWGNCVGIHPETMKTLGFRNQEVVKIESSQGEVEISVFPFPGLHPRAIWVGRGGGHKDPRSTITFQVGVDPLQLISKRWDLPTGLPASSMEEVHLTATGKFRRLAAMQKHNDMANRKDIVKMMTIQELENKKPKDLDKVPDLFPKLEEDDHRWGMAIDLNRCTGCGACMTACAVENNVPQVGREQVLLGREMHWIRLDRYFSGGIDRPVVTFVPVMCQHCQHAPCEAVCPVFATTHDPQGLNGMTYNRCIGTRYCANACPYKVRRFNWWTHRWGRIGEDVKERDRNPRALNPDVTVRVAGIMEKCTMCVGRLRDARHKALYDSSVPGKVPDGAVQTACQQTCPSDAIIFGNLKDPQSQVSKARKDPRAYLMLGGDPEAGHYGLKTLPGVSYLAVVNREPLPENSTGEGAYPTNNKHHHS